MLKAVIFDMDGVIFDSEPLHLALEQKLFKSLNVNLSDEEHHTFVGTTSHYMWNTIKTKYKLINTLEELVEADRGGYYKYLCQDNIKIEPIRGVDTLIDKLYRSKYKLAVASSSPMNIIEKVMDVFNLKGYFNTLVTGDDVDRSKPEPDIFLYAADALEVNYNECLVVEDSYNGVIAAKKAGMKCIGYINKNSGNQDLSAADIVIDEYSKIDLKDINNLFK